MAPKHLVLLPGLDGTGELFVDFIAALSESWTATIVAYPTDRLLSYTDLRPFVSGRVQEALDCDARDDLRRTTVPLLYLEATYDRLLSSSCKEEFSHLRPDTLFKSVPAPHLLLQREPQKAATVMMAFIRGLPPSPG